MTELRDYGRTLPPKPGVYLYHGPGDEVLYVGKAKNLRSRVSSYWRKSAGLTASKELMLTEIRRIETILVNSETEALLLESTLIKKYRPKYNVILKDDKYFQYIKVNLREPFPSLTTVRRMTLDGSRYFGPYTSGLAVRRTMRLLKHLFPYKSCSNPPERPCFDYQLGRCLGHDIGPGSQKRYRGVIDNLIRFLEGNTGDVLKNLRQQMQTAAKERDFETAARLRDRLLSLEHILEEQTVITSRGGSFDVASLARLEDIAAVNLFQVRGGKLVQRDQFILQHTEGQSDADVICAFAQQYYTLSTNHPREVFVPVPLPDTVGNALQISFHQAKRGLKRKLVTMGTANAAEHLRREKDNWLSAEAKARLGLQELARALNLPEPPKRIEMYDISNFQGKHPVGSMVVFENGQPKKSDYRKFAVRDTTIPDDMHRLAEVVRRRFAHLPQEKSRPHPGDAGTMIIPDGADDEAPEAWPVPDLLLLDGGKPQLSVVTKSVPGLLAHIPVAALAKEEEELFIPRRSSSIRLPKDSQELFLIQRIRDEAHRFAIGFYRKKHGRESIKSALDEVPGLGPVMKKKLLTTFGTVQGIREANDADVEKVLGAKLTATLREHI